MSGSSTRFLFFLLAIALTVMPGCAAKSKSISDMKIGLHIDAVLEFVIEYPLKWQKERRLEYGRNEGEIRWRHPSEQGTSLQVTSRLRQYQDDEQELGRALKDYPGLAGTPRQQVELPAGQAWQLSNQAAQQHVELYLLRKPNRVYTIVLQTSVENAADYEEFLAKITHSFQMLANENLPTP